MALSMPPNTTCDIYRAGSAPPAAPSVAGVPCHLEADFLRRNESGEGDSAASRCTHIMYVDKTVDIRDDTLHLASGASPDEVYVPDQNGTKFRVRFVERVNYRQAGDMKRVYLDRGYPTYPTNEL